MSKAALNSLIPLRDWWMSTSQRVWVSLPMVVEGVDIVHLRMVGVMGVRPVLLVHPNMVAEGTNQDHLSMVEEDRNRALQGIGRSLALLNMVEGVIRHNDHNNHRT